MFEFVLITAVFIILLTKIHKIEDRLNALDKRQVVAQPSIENKIEAPALSVPVPQIVNVQKPTAVETEEKWGRILGIAGVVAVILGVSFFLRYAFVNNLIGVTGRVIIGIIAGVAFVSVGQYVREKYRAYSNILMGCGIGLLYLTTYASFAFYNLVSSPVAYGLLVGISALAVVLSIVDNAMVLAMIGVVGGFLTPMFMTLSNASLAQILSYILILDIGVMAIAYVYKWRKLTIAAFSGTWILIILSFANLYEKSDRLSMCVFLFLYFVIFLASSILHHIIRREVSDSKDLAIITVNGFAYVAVTYSLLYEQFKNFMGFFMLVMALLYFAIAFLSYKTNKENKLLNIFLPAMAALFLTLVIPAQFDGPWIALAWFVEVLIMYFIDYTLKAKNLYVYGSIIFVISALYTFIRYVDDVVYGASFKFIWNERFFIFLVGIITAYILAAILYKAIKNGINITQNLKSLIAFYFVVAQVATVFLITSEISNFYSSKIYTQTESLNKEIAQLQQSYYGSNAYNSTNTMTQAQIDDYQALIKEKNLEIYNVTSTNSNQKNTVINIVWIAYALLSIAIGFLAKSKWFRITGMVLMALAAIKIFVDVWNLGPVYRIVTSLVFGVIALVASFIYAKYKDKLKSGAATLMVLGLFVLPQVTSAATDKEMIQASPYRVEISSASIVEGRPTRFVVPPEVQEKSNISDLRVFTGIGVQMPYTLNYSSFGDEQMVVNLDVKNISERNGHLEFILDNKNDTLLTHNSLLFPITSASPAAQTNFRYIVKVYGSDVPLSLDSNNWRELSLGDSSNAKPQYIFNFYDASTRQSVSNSSISYEPSNSRYLKVVLIPFDKNVLSKTDVNFQNALLDFKSSYVGLSGVITQPALISGLKESSLTKEAKIVQNEKNQTTEIYVDFMEKGVLLNGIDLFTSSTDFYRNVSVQVKNDLVKDEWVAVQEMNSHVYSFKKSDGTKLENFHVNTGAVKASHYKIVIDNQDNQPLVLEPKIAFNAPVTVLTFVPRSSGPFYLYFGGELKAPVYDIDSVLQNTSLKQKDISTVVLSSVVSNPEYKPVVVTVPFSERYSWLLNVTLVLLVGFIGLLIGMYVRRVRG